MNHNINEKIVISKFYTPKAIHNHSGKTSDLPTVLNSIPRPHHLSSYCSKYKYFPAELELLEHVPAAETLIQPLRVPNYNMGFYMKEM